MNTVIEYLIFLSVIATIASFVLVAVRVTVVSYQTMKQKKEIRKYIHWTYPVKRGGGRK